MKIGKMTGGVPACLCVTVAVALFAGCVETDIARGNASLELGDYTMAARFYNRALERNPSSFDARLGIGKALLQQAVSADNDTVLWNRALVHLEAARTLNPGEDYGPLFSEAWGIHARNLLKATDTVGALAALSRAIELQPRSAEPFNLAGILYFRLGDPDKAAILFERAAFLDSLHPSAEFNLGMIHWDNGDIEGARSHWLIALKRAPEDEDLLYWFALAEKSAGEISP